MYNAFISYRKSSSVNADFIRYSIVTQSVYKTDDIFLDKHSIGPELFDTKIKAAISSSRCMVLLVTKDCFKSKSKGEEDWFLEEIKTAIARKKKIIPVLFDNIRSLNEGDILSDLRCSFNDHEIEILTKSQSVLYSTEYPDASIQKLVSFLEEANQENELKQRIIAGMQLLGLAIGILMAFFLLFFGLGALWGYFSSSISTDKVLIDNTIVNTEDETMHFEYRGWDAIYDLKNDTIIINISEYDFKPKIRDADLLLSSLTFASAKLLLKKNLSYLKYAKFLKGGSKQAKIAFVCASAAACIGAFCGFSQGNNFGKSKRQEETALALYPKLKRHSTWEPVVKNNILLAIPYYFQEIKRDPHITILGTPIDSVCVAYQAGIHQPMALLQYNDWEIGTNTYNDMLAEIKRDKYIEKQFIFMNMDDFSIAEYHFYDSIVGIKFSVDIEEKVDNEVAINKYQEWKLKKRNSN